MFDAEIDEMVTSVANRCELHDQRIALAESCTAGLVSAWLGRRPGISEWLCGSLVTYRTATKEAWLGLAGRLLSEFTAVSRETSAAMALALLDRTPEAQLGIAVTGHLGPEAPPTLDGQIFVAAAWRSASGPRLLAQQQIKLTARQRASRQMEAALTVLRFIRDLPAGGG